MRIRTKIIAFTLAEVLLVAFIISIMVMFLSLIPKVEKVKFKERNIQHGQFACTKIDNIEYFSVQYDKRNVPLPALSAVVGPTTNLPTSGVWIEGNCGASLWQWHDQLIASNVKELSILLIGGGAGGENGREITDNNKSNAFLLPTEPYGSPTRCISDVPDQPSCTFRVPRTGKYDITVYGQSGERSYIEPWNSIPASNMCYARPAPPGDGASVIRKNYDLNEGDILTLNVIPASPQFGSPPNERPASSCSSGITGNIHMGRHGGTVTLSRNSVRISSIIGSRAGVIVCTPGSSNNCALRFQTKDAPFELHDLRGSVVPGALGGAEQPFSGVNGGVYIKENATIEIKHGCGGGSGSMAAGVYSFKRRNLPAVADIIVGSGGLAGANGDKSTFGTIAAQGGHSPGRCPVDTDIGGADGIALPFLPMFENIVSTSGIGGTVSNPNGGDASGIGSGGGGGLGSPVGSGGNGAPGVLIITW